MCVCVLHQTFYYCFRLRFALFFFCHFGQMLLLCQHLKWIRCWNNAISFICLALIRSNRMLLFLVVMMMAMMLLFIFNINSLITILGIKWKILRKSNDDDGTKATNGGTEIEREICRPMNGGGFHLYFHEHLFLDETQSNDFAVSYTFILMLIFNWMPIWETKSNCSIEPFEFQYLSFSTKSIILLILPLKNCKRPPHGLCNGLPLLLFAWLVLVLLMLWFDGCLLLALLPFPVFVL